MARSIDRDGRAGRCPRDVSRLDAQANLTYANPNQRYFPQVEQWFFLQTIDALWKDHLLTMDHLRQGIGLRGYGQKDPK